MKFREVKIFTQTGAFKNESY